MEETLYERVRDTVHDSICRKRTRRFEAGELNRLIDETINNWTPLELLSAISLELEEMLNG